MMRVSRLVRAILRGGVAVRSPAGWKVYRSRDLRATSIGCLSNNDVHQLLQEDLLKPFDADHDILEATDRARDSVRLPQGSPAPVLPSPRPNRVRKRGLLAAALEACGDNSDRALSAARSYCNDIEQASSSGAFGINWDSLGTRVQGGQRHDRLEGPGQMALRALARIRATHQHLPAQDRSLLASVLVSGHSASEIERRSGLKRQNVPQYVAEALLALADVYDRHIPSAYRDRGRS